MSYDYLICTGVMQLFGFRVNAFLFDKYLSKADFHNMSTLLETCFYEFNINIKDDQQKQVYILSLGMCTIQEKKTTVQYMIENMPGGVCPELSDIPGTLDDCEKLQKVLDEILDEDHKKPDLKSLLCSLKSQFHFLISQESKLIAAPEYAAGKLGPTTEKLLQALEIKQYYPQKLTYEDVIKLTADVFEDVNKKPTTLTELPWYFMRHIIGLDSDTRKDCHVPEESDESGNESENEDEDIITKVHPLDLIYIIFLCADDFLRQELADKMAKLSVCSAIYFATTRSHHKKLAPKLEFENDFQQFLPQ